MRQCVCVCAYCIRAVHLHCGEVAGVVCVGVCIAEVGRCQKREAANGGMAGVVCVYLDIASSILSMYHCRGRPYYSV